MASGRSAHRHSRRFVRRLTPCPQSCAVNEPQGVRRRARERRIGLLVAAIAAAFALASSAAELSDPT